MCMPPWQRSPLPRAAAKRRARSARLIHCICSENWWVIGASATLFAVEFFFKAKVLAFDLIWNALHTFIRVPIAALLAWRATATLTPGEQLAATLLGGLIALAAHGGKTAVRAAVTPSPEPFSNIGLSLGEDVLAVSLTWLSTVHPYIGGGIALAFVLAAIVSAHCWVWRALRALSFAEPNTPSRVDSVLLEYHEAGNRRATEALNKL